MASSLWCFYKLSGCRTWMLLSKFADNTKWGGTFDSPKSIEALQWDLDKLEKRAITNCLTFNKSKCYILHTGRGNPEYTYRLGAKVLESSLTGRDLGGSVRKKLNMSQQHALAAKSAILILRYIRQTVDSWLRDGIFLLCHVLVGPHLDYCVQFGTSQCKKDIKLLESV